MMGRGFFHIIFYTIFIVTLAALLPAYGMSSVSAANIITRDATDITATWATLNGEITYFGDGSCGPDGGPCTYGGVQPLFVVIPQRGMDPLEVQFHDISAGNPTTWQWDFGDGTTSIEQNPKHRYEKPGKYLVTLWVRNNLNSGALVYLEYIVIYDSPQPISIITNLATDVTTTDATLNGSLIDLELDASVDVFFKYGEAPNFETLGDYISVDAGRLSSVGEFNAPISGLAAGTPYYFQACAKTDTGKEVCGTIAPLVSVPRNIDVFFKYGTDPNLLTNILLNVGTLSTEGVFSAPVSGLTAGTRYYFQACGTNVTGDTCGAILSFVYDPVTVVTTTVTGVTVNSATLNGAVTSLGDDPSVAVFFKYGVDPTLTTSNLVNAGTLSSAGAFNADISITAGTLYYFQACATGSTGDACGTILSFMMFDPCPIASMNVVTNPATGVSATGATLNGAVTDMGGESSVAVFFRYGTDPTFGAFSRVEVGVLSSVGMFNAPISGLVTGNQYYFQACGTGSTGEVCGAVLSLVSEMSMVPELTVVTATPTGVSGSGATLNGVVTGMGGESSVAVFFRYGTDPTFGAFSRVDAGVLSNAGVFSAPVSGLTPGTMYYFRACATSSAGDVCDEMLAFVVLVEPCPVPTDTPIPTPILTYTLTLVTIQFPKGYLKSVVAQFRPDTDFHHLQ